MANRNIIEKWLTGELSDEEKTEFESSEEYADLRKLSEALPTFKAPGYNSGVEYEKFSEKILNKARTISLYDRLKPVFKIAAIIIIALSVGYFSIINFSRSLNEGVWIAEQSEVYLPDSSLAMLNTGSKIRFAEKTWKSDRNVELKGEAFFKVKKGSRFNVRTNQGVVTVLGTQFNVKDWKNFYEVACYKGLVRVVSNQDTVLLKPGNAFRVVNGNRENYTFSNKPDPDWLHGESSFKSVPLSFVFADLERQYNISIEANNVDLNQLFTGSFSHNNLEIALESVTIPVNLSYKVNENKVVITFEKK